FVLLTASKGHFRPGCNVFCPFDSFKKTFRTQTRLLLVLLHHAKEQFDLTVRLVSLFLPGPLIRILAEEIKKADLSFRSSLVNAMKIHFLANATKTAIAKPESP
ncbi:hypothetical protein, partial [Heyndrickxia coagulans]